MEPTDWKIQIEMMSGVEDGLLIERTTAAGDGEVEENRWTLSIGRMDSCSIRLSTDTLVSRVHAHLTFRDNRWWLIDADSRNGSFIHSVDSFFNDIRVREPVPLDVDTWFRIGRTWMCIVSYVG